jgi:hypothetical protein
MGEQLSGRIKKALKGSSERIFWLAHEELPLRSGRWSLPSVPGDHADRAVEWCQVSRPVRLDAGAVRQQFPGVLEHHDTVAEQAPSLLRVAHDGVCRFAVGI